ncbi:MAG: hypothetical protein ACYDG4_13485 [Desulfuromonadaceae bacterium]
MAQTVENRGGERAGSGRKRMSISDGEVKKLLREFRKKEKETGISPWGKLAEIAYRDGTAKRATIKEQTVAIKLFAECVITRASESETTVTKNDKPAIYLPEQRTDPANVVPIKKAGNG